MDEKILAYSKSEKKKSYAQICFGVLFIVVGVLLPVITEEDFLWCATGFLGCVGISIISYKPKCCEITVTDKRIYGLNALGAKVNLPLDSVSSVESFSQDSSLSKNAFVEDYITIGTSSGKMSFSSLKNQDEICKVIQNLINDRQIKANAPVQSDADELKKYKELLDNGVISQEEFDAKKKQLLGL